MTLLHGPDRVLINGAGDAIPFRDARKQGKFVEIVFIRNDGWSLGANRHLYGVAYNMYKDEWAAVIVKPSLSSITVDEFLEKELKGRLFPPVKIDKNGNTIYDYNGNTIYEHFEDDEQ